MRETVKTYYERNTEKDKEEAVKIIIHLKSCIQKSPSIKLHKSTSIMKIA